VTRLACGQAATSAARKVEAKMSALKLKLEADQRRLEKQQRKAMRRERRERRAQRKAPAATPAAPATMATMAMAALAARSVVAVEDTEEHTDVHEEDAADYTPMHSRLLTNYALSPGWGGDDALVGGGVESTHPPVRLALASHSRVSPPHASQSALRDRRASSRDSCSSAGGVEGLPAGGDGLPAGGESPVERLLATADRAPSPELQSPHRWPGPPQAWYQQVPLSAPDRVGESCALRPLGRAGDAEAQILSRRHPAGSTTDEARGPGGAERAGEAADSDEIESLHARHVNFSGTTDADADTAKDPGGGVTLTLWDLLDENTSLQRRMRRRASMAKCPPWKCPHLAPVFPQGLPTALGAQHSQE